MNKPEMSSVAGDVMSNMDADDDPGIFPEEDLEFQYSCYACGHQAMLPELPKKYCGKLFHESCYNGFRAYGRQLDKQGPKMKQEAMHNFHHNEKQFQLDVKPFVDGTSRPAARYEYSRRHVHEDKKEDFNEDRQDEEDHLLTRDRFRNVFFIS